ncbi:MAG: hypothetical protein AAFT19_02855, partial [Pseudomonadota bacterium]
MREHLRSLALLLAMAAVLCGAVMAQAQQAAPVTGPAIGAASDSEAPQRPAIPEVLTPELVDAMLATLTDEQVRELLREEMKRQAQAPAEADAAGAAMGADLARRLDAMLLAIGQRLSDWRVALGALDERAGPLSERLALG